MKTDVKHIEPQDLAETAARRMRDENIAFLPVCDANHRVVGVLTDRDIVIRMVAENRAPSTPVQELMTHEIIGCSPDDPIERAEFLMGRAKVSRIMCIDPQNGRLVGVISLSDIAQVEVPPQASETMREVSSREVRH